VPKWNARTLVQLRNSGDLQFFSCQFCRFARRLGNHPSFSLPPSRARRSRPYFSSMNHAASEGSAPLHIRATGTLRACRWVACRSSAFSAEVPAGMRFRTRNTRSLMESAPEARREVSPGRKPWVSVEETIEPQRGGTEVLFPTQKHPDLLHLSTRHPERAARFPSRPFIHTAASEGSAPLHIRATGTLRALRWFLPRPRLQPCRRCSIFRGLQPLKSTIECSQQML